MIDKEVPNEFIEYYSKGNHRGIEAKIIPKDIVDMIEGIDSIILLKMTAETINDEYKLEFPISKSDDFKIMEMLLDDEKDSIVITITNEEDWFFRNFKE